MGFTKYTDFAVGLALVVILTAYVIVPAISMFYNSTVGGGAWDNVPAYVATLFSVAIGIGASVAILVFLLGHIGGE